MADLAPRVDRIAALRGIAALQAALGEIGAESGPGGDSRLAKHVVENEVELRQLAKYALAKLACE